MDKYGIYGIFNLENRKSYKNKKYCHTSAGFKWKYDTKAT